MPKLNPNEAPPGYVAVKSLNCDGCAFSPFGSIKCDQARCACPCGPHRRKDECNVIFKLKIYKPARNPREWMAWSCMPSGPEFLPYVFRNRAQARDNANGRQVIRVKITEVMP